MLSLVVNVSPHSSTNSSLSLSYRKKDRLKRTLCLLQRLETSHPDEIFAIKASVVDASRVYSTRSMEITDSHRIAHRF